MAFSAGQRLNASDLNGPIAILRQSVAQSLTDAAFTTITFDTEDLDTHNGHSTSVNTSRYTAQKAGRHLFVGGIGFAINSVGARGSRWLLNGAGIGRGQSMYGNAGGTLVTLITTRIVVVSMVVGDYVELQAYQASGGALNTAVLGTQESHIDVWYLN